MPGRRTRKPVSAASTIFLLIVAGILVWAAWSGNIASLGQTFGKWFVTMATS